MRKYYIIKEHPYYGIYPGFSADNKPIVAFSGYPSVILVFFDDSGAMIDTSHHPPFLTKQLRRSDEGVVDLERAYLKSLGMVTFEPVTVRKFWAGDGIGIDDYPSTFKLVLPDHEEDFLKQREIFKDFYGDNWKQAFDDEIRDLKEQKQAWDNSGAWVLYHGNDYWVDADGNITDS